MSDEKDHDDLLIAPALVEGDAIGERYQVVRLLGQGGIGRVYEAVNTWTGRHVAVKVLRKADFSGDDILRRFKLEAQIAAQLRHPNIVEVLDMGPDPRSGAIFIVQELLKGTDLRRYVAERGKLDPSEAFDLLVPVMGALAAAHAKGFLHRDVKPENIFLVQNEDGTVTPKLIDFGLAKVLGEEAAKRGKTRSGFAIGTPSYMSPEQFQGPGDVDLRADVWAVGVVLYEILSGGVPFDGPTILDILRRISMEPPHRLDLLVPTIPRDVADLVHSALQADRALRFASMRVLLDKTLALPSLSVPGVQSLAERHQRSLGAIAESRASGPPPDGTAATVVQPTPALLPPAASKAPPPPPSPALRPASLDGSGERPSELPLAPTTSSSRQMRVAATVVVVTAVFVVGGISLLSRSLSHTSRIAPAARPAVATVVPAEAADPAVVPGDVATETPPALAQPPSAPAQLRDRVQPRRRVARPAGTAAGAAPTARATPHGGYDPDRLLTP